MPVRDGVILAARRARPNRGNVEFACLERRLMQLVHELQNVNLIFEIRGIFDDDMWHGALSEFAISASDAFFEST